MYRLKNRPMFMLCTCLILFSCLVNAQNQPFSFAVLSDTHDVNTCNIAQGKWVSEAVELINSKNPAFVVGVGDLIAGIGGSSSSNCVESSNTENQLVEFKRVLLDPLNAPFIPVGGNHDLSGGAIIKQKWGEFWDENKNQVLNSGSFSGFPESYRFTYNNIGFSIIDYYSTWGFKQVELDWINTNVVSGDLVFRHINPYGIACFCKPDGTYGPDCNDEMSCNFAIRNNHLDPNQLTNTLKEKGVKGLFSGHNHAFYDGVCGDLRFINTGTLAKRMVGYAKGLDRNKYGTQSFVWVDVTSNGEMTVSFYFYNHSNNQFELFDKSEFPETIDSEGGVRTTCTSVRDNLLGPTAALGTTSSSRGSNSQTSSNPITSSSNSHMVCGSTTKCEELHKVWRTIGSRMGKNNFWKPSSKFDGGWVTNFDQLGFQNPTVQPSPTSTPTPTPSPITNGNMVSSSSCVYCKQGKENLRLIDPTAYSSCTSDCCSGSCPPGTKINSVTPFISQCDISAMGEGGDCWHDGVPPERTNSNSAESYCTSGCGVASLRMALKSFNVDRSSRDLFCGGSDSVYNPGGSSSSKIKEVAIRSGLSDSRLNSGVNWDDMVSQLKSGKVIVLSLADVGRISSNLVERPYITEGHFITLHGASDNYVIANDPGRRSTSVAKNVVLSKSYIETVGRNYVVVS